MLLFGQQALRVRRDALYTYNDLARCLRALKTLAEGVELGLPPLLWCEVWEPTDGTWIECAFSAQLLRKQDTERVGEALCCAGRRNRTKKPLLCEVWMIIE